MGQQKVRVKVLRRYWQPPPDGSSRRSRWAMVEIAGLEMALSIHDRPAARCSVMTRRGGDIRQGRHFRDALAALERESRATHLALLALGFGHPETDAGHRVVLRTQEAQLNNFVAWLTDVIDDTSVQQLGRLERLRTSVLRNLTTLRQQLGLLRHEPAHAPEQHAAGGAL